MRVFYRMMGTAGAACSDIFDGKERKSKRFRRRPISIPSISSFNSVQSISRVRTARQSLKNFPASNRFPHTQ
jgi:hypothetical protein